MKTQTKLERKGYKVVYCMSGKVIAKKGNQTYMADNITQLYNKILKPEW